MNHVKTYYAKEIDTPKGTIIIEGPVTSEHIQSLDFHEDLVAFRPAKEQHKALVKIAEFPEGRIIIARNEQMIIGYVTFLYPDPIERWSEIKMPDLIELGAVEVISNYRGYSIGKGLLQLSMQDDAMEDFIIITTEYYWHWDLKGTGLNIWEYRKIMEKMMNAGGLEYFATDEPEICSHPANCLMARIGKRVPPQSIEKFDQLRLKNRAK